MKAASEKRATGARRRRQINFVVDPADQLEGGEADDTLDLQKLHPRGEDRSEEREAMQRSGSLQQGRSSGRSRQLSTGEVLPMSMHAQMFCVGCRLQK